MVRLGWWIEGERGGRAYLRRMRMARPMTATTSWPMLTSRLARVMCDGLLVPSHRHQEVVKVEITVGNKSTLPMAAG